MASLKEKECFLKQVQEALELNNVQILSEREIYFRTLAQLGITNEIVLDDIGELTINERWDKRPDNNPIYADECVWICKKHLHGKLIYIKLKIKEKEKSKLLIMSYHIDGMRKGVY